MSDVINRNCWAHHLGLYAIEPMWLRGAVAAIQAGTWPVVEAARRGADEPRELYTRTADGVAVIQMSGPMMKGTSKYPHVNTLDVRRGLHQAARDDKVGAVVLAIDSPGGMVAGTQELADDVRRIDAEAKPVYAHIDDLGASAAYWVASQARRITANRTAEIGSIGVVAQVVDTSQAYALEGVKVHVVSTGPYKGAFADGAPVTDDQLEYLKDRVADVHAHFLEAIEAGRPIHGKSLENVADGRVFGANQAQAMGLVDAIQSLDDTVSEVGAQIQAGKGRARVARKRAEYGWERSV